MTSNTPILVGQRSVDGSAIVSSFYLETASVSPKGTTMRLQNPIRRVSVVSTGQVQIRPDHVSSTWRPMFLWLLTSRQWTGPRPINAYVIEHREGLVLFDTGQDRASVTDPDYFPGGIAKVLYDRLARFEIGPQETLTAGLGRLGYTTNDVHTAILSHLHQDHIGGLGELSTAEIIVSQTEWDTLSTLRPELRGLMTRHIDLPGLRWNRISPAPPRTRPFRSLQGVTTCLETAAWCSCPHLDTHLARCPCSCVNPDTRRS